MAAGSSSKALHMLKSCLPMARFPPRTETVCRVYAVVAIAAPARPTILVTEKLGKPGALTT